MSQLNSQTRSQWKEVILKQKASGVKPGQYCLDNGLKIHQFQYYQGILFPKESKKSPFVEVKPINHFMKSPQASKITLQFNDLTLSFEGDHDHQRISDLVFALRGSK